MTTTGRRFWVIVVPADADRAARPATVLVELGIGHVDAVLAHALGEGQHGLLGILRCGLAVAAAGGSRRGRAAVERGHVGRSFTAAPAAGREHHHGRHAQEGSA